MIVSWWWLILTDVLLINSLLQHYNQSKMSLFYPSLSFSPPLFVQPTFTPGVLVAKDSKFPSLSCTWHLKYDLTEMKWTETTEKITISYDWVTAEVGGVVCGQTRSPWCGNIISTGANVISADAEFGRNVSHGKNIISPHLPHVPPAQCEAAAAGRQAGRQHDAGLRVQRGQLQNE